MSRPNKKRENQKSSINASVEVLDENSAVVKEYLALNDGVILLKSDIEDFDKKEKVFEAEMNGKTPAKHSARDFVEAAIHSLGRALRSYSSPRKANKPEIFALVDIEESDLEKLRDTELLKHSKAVLDKANENAADLVAYKVKPQELTDAGVKINDFEKSLKTQAAGMADKSSDYDLMLFAFAKVKEDLLDIDDMMERIREEQPAFYDAYKIARHVKQLGTRHNKPAQPATQAQPIQK